MKLTGNVEDFKLKLKAIPFGTQEIKYHLDAGFFNDIEKTEVRRASVEATVVVTRKEADFFQLEMTCSGSLIIPCDRCLDDMEHEVDARYRLDVKQEGDEVDDSRDELLIVPEAWRELDVAPLLRDTVLLTIPLTHSHDDAAQCNSEMMTYLCGAAEPAHDDEQDGAEATDPRWKALRQLKKNK